MKKTIFTILGVGLLALTSCVGGLSVDEIKAKAEEIKTHNTATDVALPTKYDVVVQMSQTTTMDGEVETVESTIHGIYSEEDYYFYMDISEGDQSMVIALYVEGTSVVLAFASDTATSVEMGSEEVAKLAYTEAFAEISSFKTTLDRIVLGIDVLDSIISICDAFKELESGASQAEGEVNEYTLKGSSSKEGSLKVEVTQHTAETDASADFTFTIEFVDYYLTSCVSAGTIIEGTNQMVMQEIININFEPELIYLPTVAPQTAIDLN